MAIDACHRHHSSSEGNEKIYTLRRGVLFRCAHPTHLTPKGASTLISELGISKMYDLRSGPEISRLATTVANSPADLYPLADPNTGTIESHAAPGLERIFTPVYQNEDYGPVALARKLAVVYGPSQARRGERVRVFRGVRQSVP